MQQKKIEITRLNHTGEGIGTLDNKIVFVTKAIPGDVIIPSKLNDCGNYFKTTIKDLETPSKDRIQIKCPYYDKCGGCQLLGLGYSKQLSYKQEKVKNILEKYAGIQVTPEIISGEEFLYRNKITLQVQNGTIGLYEVDSNTLVPINSCLLVSDSINEIILWLTETLKSEELKDVKQIMLRKANNQIMLQFLGRIDLKDKIDILSTKVSSIFINDTLIKGSYQIEEQLGKYKFGISPSSFFQVNHHQTVALYDQVKEYLGKNHNHILDLYCGTGTIGIYVSENCQKVTGIEINASSVRDAKSNVKKNSLKNIKIIQGKVEDHLKAGKQYDAIIVDPPRSGLDKKTKRILQTIKSPKIIYISCNPVTLARDIKDLEQEYKLEKIKLVDMFPNTYHVESVVSLTLKETIFI